MKPKILLLASLVIGLNLGIAHAQPRGPRGAMGGPPSGPQFGGYLAKIFGEDPEFSATMEFQVNGGAPDESIMPGKVSVSGDKLRFEMEMSELKSKSMSPQAVAGMKQMGFDKMVMISRSDKKTSYMIVPGMKAYVENPVRDADSVKAASDYKTDETKLGEEKISGHDCLKYKVVNTGSDGVTHESLVWRAGDLKGFPVKIQDVEEGKTTVWLLKDVKMGKPEASQFEPPADFTKYGSFMELMLAQMQIPH